VRSKIRASAGRILRVSKLQPVVAVILGSGFSALRDALEPAAELTYAALPGFLPCRVDGHCGKLLIGRLAGLPVLLLCGRSHYYEGHSMAAITFPVRVLAQCGIRILLLTNAAGGINPRYRPGDFMAVTDHLNFMGTCPLRGPGTAQRSGFVDLGQTYDPHLTALLGRAARQARVRLHFGVYLAVSGPAFETPAEIRAFARLGADAVGMSTVPEAIVARQCGLRVAAVSCITNPAAGLGNQAISHHDVLAVGDRVQSAAAALLTGFMGRLAPELEV
jgi:purine-nucleoside phosphorylase